MNFVDIDKDKEILLEDLELSERAKNTLRRFLRVKTFGDLLNVDYEILENTRSLGSITLEEIKGQYIDINGIKAMVTYSAKDLFSMLEYYPEDEVYKTAEQVAEDVANTLTYLDSLNKTARR